jgi:hypothetical protein
MSALLTSTMVASGNVMYHSAEFLSFVHSHETYLKNACISTPLDPGIVHKFEFNFMSLLVELGYPVEDLIIFMVVNDFNCITDMTADFKEIRIPDLAVVENLKTLYRQTPGRI